MLLDPISAVFGDVMPGADGTILPVCGRVIGNIPQRLVLTPIFGKLGGKAGAVFYG
jgi:hypothetical protein